MSYQIVFVVGPSVDGLPKDSDSIGVIVGVVVAVVVAFVVILVVLVVFMRHSRRRLEKATNRKLSLFKLQRSLA